MNESAEFDRFADNYREVHTKNVRGLSGADSNYFSEYKIIEIKSSLEGCKILDFGCGDGNSAFFIQQHIKKYCYTGIDVSEESIKKARCRNIAKSDFLPYDGCHIPFPDDSFDIVFAACVFHHIDDENHIPVPKEIHRVLKKGGKFIVFEHNPWNPLTVKIVHDCPFDEGVTLISAGKMLRKMKLSGFNGRGTCYTIFMPRKGIFKKMLSLEKLLRRLPFGGQYYCIGEK